jgi:uncharacterized protein YneF (UPF0154 family)
MERRQAMNTKSVWGIAILLAVVVGGVFLANWLMKKTGQTTA